MSRIDTIVVGTGGWARYHIRGMLERPRLTRIVGFVEPGQASRDATEAMFSERKLACPPFYATVEALVAGQGTAEVALICSPHACHFAHAKACLEAGMDVCIEKPMVMNAAEARRLIRLRDKTGRLVMVAFPGSLSPAIWKAKQLIARGAIGEVRAISAYAHQQWKRATTGTWRQDPAVSGGGFLFDTGSHMINTVVDLMDSDVASVQAVLDHRGTPVEIDSAVSGVAKNGIVFSLAGAGDSVQCCSAVHVFGTGGVLRTGIWGESLTISRGDRREYEPVPFRPSPGAWPQFLRVRAGRFENPCPAETGLRFALLMDRIRQHAIVRA